MNIRYIIETKANQFQVMKGLIIILLLSAFACSPNVEITEEEIMPDIFYIEGSYGPFTGKCTVVAMNNKQVMEEFTYKNGRLHGQAKTWYKNGKIKRSGSFQDGKLSGKWEYWDESGKMLSETNYQNDEMVSILYPPH